MTVDEMIFEVYSQLGKPSDLRPLAENGEDIDIDTAGARRILGWLNRGYKRILTWRFPNGRIARFRSMDRQVVFQATVLDGTLVAATATSVTFPVALADQPGRYAGWYIGITAGTGAGQKRLLGEYNAGRIGLVYPAWTTTPDATSTFELYKNFYNFVAPGHPWASENIEVNPSSGIVTVVKVSELEDGSSLLRADRVQQFTSVGSGAGRPTFFQDAGSGLIFNSVIVPQRAYMIRYYGFPAELSAITEEPEMPAQFHEAVLLWTIWWGLRRYQEFSGAFSTKRDLDELMNSLVQQFDMANEREDISLYVGGH